MNIADTMKINNAAYETGLYSSWYAYGHRRDCGVNTFGLESQCNCLELSTRDAIAKHQSTQCVARALCLVNG